MIEINKIRDIQIGTVKANQTGQIQDMRMNFCHMRKRKSIALHSEEDTVSYNCFRMKSLFIAVAKKRIYLAVF